MALQYGMNFLASDMRNILEQNQDVQNGVRTWQKLFGNASLGNQAQVGALKADYSDAIVQAYKANLAQRNSILGAGLSAGSTEALLDTNRQNLHNTYRQYLGGYNSDMTTLNQNYQQEVGVINDALNERAKNFSDLYSSAYKYLADRLSGASFSRDDMTKPLYDEDGNFTGYEQKSINYLDAAKLDWLRDTEGNLLSWNQIANSLIDSNGAVTDKGREFFDKIFNATPQGYLDEEGEKVVGFDEWLAEENSELRDWMVGSDEFSTNKVGSNLGTAKEMLGLEADDFTGANFNYLTAEDIDAVASNARTYLSGLIGSLSKMGDAVKNYENAVTNSLAPHSTVAEINQSESALRGAEKEVNKEWTNYKTDLEKEYSKFTEKLKYALGADKYNEFMSSDAIKAYTDAFDQASKTTKYDKNVYDSLNTEYKNFITAAEKFMAESIGLKWGTTYRQKTGDDYLKALYKHLGIEPK